MDFYKVYSKIREIDQGKSTITENCGASMPGTQIPTAPPIPPVSMNMNISAQGVDQIKELISLISATQPADKPGPSSDIIDIEPKADIGKDQGLPDLLKLAGAGEKESYANEPEERISSIDKILPSGDDLHKSKRMFKKANGGDNAMAIEGIRAQLDRRYREIKEGKE